MSTPADPHDHHDDVPALEADQTIPPRPEEELADLQRAELDAQDSARQENSAR